MTSFHKFPNKTIKEEDAYYVQQFLNTLCHAIQCTEKWKNSATSNVFSILMTFLDFFLCLTDMMNRPKRIFLCVGFGGITKR